MEVFNNIHLLGTSHIASQSIRDVKSAFEQVNPDIVTVELDVHRAYALKHRTKRPRDITLLKSLGLFGYLFYVLGEYLQKKLGKVVSIDPGSEMLAALKLAESHKVMVFFIDRDIAITLRRFSRYFKKREMLRMLWDLVKGFFIRDKSLSFNLAKVPSREIIRKVVEQSKLRYPSLYRILIGERDKIMADNLQKISELYPHSKILAIMGAGHLDGVLYHLGQRNF